MSLNRYIMGQAGQSPEDYNSPVSPSQLANQAQQNLDPNYVDPNDSGDPCDPNSAYYDVDYCAQQNDSGDPCDPASMYYDPASCPDDNQDAGNDSGDPCDPSSQVYDPDYCQQLQGGGDDGSSYQDQGSAAPAAPSAAPGYGGGDSAAAPYTAPTPIQDFSPMDPPPPGANAANATAPDGGTYSTTPTPYTDANGNPTDAYGDPSDAYGNPLNSAGQPVDSAGNTLPTDANGNADPSLVDSGDPCDPNSTAYNPATCNQNTAATTPPPPLSSGAFDCTNLVFPVTVDQLAYITGDPSTQAQAIAGRQYLMDQTGPLGEVAIFPMPILPGLQGTPAYALVHTGILVTDPNTGKLTYMAFADLSGAAYRIYSSALSSDHLAAVHQDDPAIIANIRANCPQYLDLQDLVTKGYAPASGYGTVDGSNIPIPGWTYQPANAAPVQNTGSATNDPCDFLSPSFDAAACQASGGTQYSSGASATDSGDPCDHTSQYYNATTCANQGAQPYAAHKTIGAKKAAPKSRATTVKKVAMRGFVGAPLNFNPKTSPRKPATARNASKVVVRPQALPGVTVPKNIKGWFVKKQKAKSTNKVAPHVPTKAVSNLLKNVPNQASNIAPSTSFVPNQARNLMPPGFNNASAPPTMPYYNAPGYLPAVRRVAYSVPSSIRNLAANVPSSVRNLAANVPVQAVALPSTASGSKPVPKAPLSLRRVSSLVSSTAAAPSNRRR